MNIYRIFRENLAFLAILAVFSMIIGCEKLKSPEKFGKEPVIQQKITKKAPSIEISQKNTWKASASGIQEDIFPARHTIDGDYGTRWSSPPSDPQWLQIDLGSEGTVTGLSILWEAAFSSEYEIQISSDGNNWQTVFKTEKGDGHTDDIYFKPVNARYVRIMGLGRGTGWGHSIYEIDIKGPSQQVQISSEGEKEEALLNLFDGDTETVWQSKSTAPKQIIFDLREPREFGGMRIDWGDNFAKEMIMFTSPEGKDWVQVADVIEGTGKFDLLMHPRKTARFIQLDIIETAHEGPITIKEVALRGPDEEVTPLSLYQLAAAKAAPGMYPYSLLKNQIYWTLVGLPADGEESLLDEFGNLEPKAGSCSLMPYIAINNKIYSALQAEDISQSLADNYLPLPTVSWKLDPVNVEIEAIAHGTKDNSATYVRYRLTNTSDKPQQGHLYLVIRPLQINPIWQHGGMSPIRSLAFTPDPEGGIVIVNNQPTFVSLTSVNGFSARAFERGDIIEDIIKDKMPQTTQLDQAGEHLSGVLVYDFNIQPNGSEDILIAAPLHNSLADIQSFRKTKNGDALTASAAFTRAQAAAKTFWTRKLGDTRIQLPQQEAMDTMKSQIAYILINQDGVSIQPGSRNYKRAWIRDGSLTSAALLRMGLTNEVRNYLDWYSRQVQPDGWVPPILENDGSINKGFGWDNEYDSQGEYIYAIMEYYRFTKDKEFLARHFDAIVRAMKYMVTLRNLTLVEGYMADHPAPERFKGILPKSISHEGYAPAMHSYWDDFWALKGWKNGQEAARIMGRDDVATWAGQEYEAMRTSMQESIKATVAYKKIDFVPGCAEKGDPDATSTAIAFFPCEEEDLPDSSLMQNSFDRYYKDLMKRLQPGWKGSFTPYEIRSIAPFVKLGQKDRAKDLLDYMLTCRRPANWNHLAEVVHSDPRLGVYIGDMPHTWVGSGYVNAVRAMLVYEENGILHLLAGTPEEWVTGEGIRITKLPTHYGTLNMTARLEGNILTVDLEGEINPENGIELYWPKQGLPKSVTFDGTACTTFDETKAQLPAGAKHIVATF